MEQNSTDSETFSSSTEETAPSSAKKLTKEDFYLPVGLILSILLIDQIIKIWIKTTMLLGEENIVFDHWFILHFTENNGIAFGQEFGGKIGKLILTLGRIIAASGIFWYMTILMKRGLPRGLIISVSLIFAGATGNILDSIFYGEVFKDINNYEGGFLFGKVVDMFYFPLVDMVMPAWVPIIGGSPFTFFEPVFNFADAAITTGVFMILLFHRNSLKDA